MRKHITNTSNPIDFAKPQESWPFPFDPTILKTMTYLDDMMKLDIRICHGYDRYNNRGGVTIAYRKASGWKSTKMVEVSLAYCSSKDSFIRKIGAQLAVERFVAGNTVMVPVRHKTDETIVGNLLDMFYYNSSVEL